MISISTCRKEDLDRVFGKYGEVGDYYIPINWKTFGNRGYGFVRYCKEEDAKKALAEDGNMINGHKITVKMAEARPPKVEYSFLWFFIKYRRKKRAARSRSRSRSHESRSRRNSRSASRSHSPKRHHHDHHSHSDRSNSNDRIDNTTTQNKSKSRSRSRSRSRSLSQENKMAE